MPKMGSSNKRQLPKVHYAASTASSSLCTPTIGSQWDKLVTCPGGISELSIMCSCNSANDSSNLIQMFSSLLLFSLLTSASLVPSPHPVFVTRSYCKQSWVGPCNKAKPIHQDQGRVLVHMWYSTPRASQTLKIHVLAEHAMVILIIRTKIHVWILWKT